MEWKTFCAWMNSALETAWQEEADSLSLITTDPQILRWFEPVQDLLKTGKRVRPYVAFLFYQLGDTSKKPEDIKHLLVGIELFHLFCLIHDDIIDHANVRRHAPTIHHLATTAHREEKRLGNEKEFGDAQALLVGDLVFAHAVEHITKASAPETLKTFFQMAKEVVIGQMIDVDLPTNTSPTAERIYEKMDLKTASYTFIRPMQMGLTEAEQTDLLPHAESFGRAIGCAFQIQDDLLDLTQSSDITGKPFASDITEHQYSVFTQHILDNGTDEQKTTLQSLFGSTEIDAETLKGLLESSGAIAAGTQQMQELFTEAQTQIASMPAPDTFKTHLLSLVKAIQARHT